MKYTTKHPAILLLSDGTIFHGKSIGISGSPLASFASTQA
jgi:carbamoyl-phosphate synthase small subunit